MAASARPPYRFGDLLAIARQSWVRQMSNELERRGYSDYRVSDAASMRLLRRGPITIGRLGAVLGVSRQAARKVIHQLEQRGFATSGPDLDDARKVNVVLTEAGQVYATAVIDVIVSLNRNISEQVNLDQLVAADIVLRAVMGDDHARSAADRIPGPLAAPLAG